MSVNRIDFRDYQSFVVMFCKPCGRLTLGDQCKKCGEQTIPAWPCDRIGVEIIAKPKGQR